MNDLIGDKLKENINLEDIIKTHNLHYKSKRRKVYNFSESSLLIYLPLFRLLPHPSPAPYQFFSL